MLAQMNPPPAFDYKPYGHHDELHYHGHHAYAGAPSYAGLSHFESFHHQDDEDEPEDDESPEDPHHDYDEASRKRKGSTPSLANGSTPHGKKEIFVCPEVHCGKTFPRSFALRRHMRIHTGTKPYSCDFEGCSQRFNTSGNLSRHKRIHSGERPYPCVFASCGKRFNTSTKLKRHMRIHFPDGQSLFHCVQHACTFACDNYKEYVHHQRQHGNPAYAAPVKPGDENLDPANAAKQPARNKGAVKAKRPPQPRVSKASKAAAAAAAATTAVLTGGDYLSGLPDRRFDHQSPSTSAASGLSMLIKEAHRENDMVGEYTDHRRKSHLLDGDRPARLPFPTGAFPSESISSASPMNLASGFGASFPSRAPPPSGSYYDQNPASSGGYGSSSSSMSSSFPSYLRGPANDGYGHHGHHASSSYHDSIHFPPLRPEDADDGYDSTSPRSSHQHHAQQHHHHHAQHHEESDHGDKYGGYSNVPHAVGPEFTGEELSAVLELMKDS